MRYDLWNRNGCCCCFVLLKSHFIRFPFSLLCALSLLFSFTHLPSHSISMNSFKIRISLLVSSFRMLCHCGMWIALLYLHLVVDFLSIDRSRISFSKANFHVFTIVFYVRNGNTFFGCHLPEVATCTFCTSFATIIGWPYGSMFWTDAPSRNSYRSDNGLAKWMPIHTLRFTLDYQ